jgi:FKBP-type peptidyl-prolyl cis-trans isomerase
MVAALVGTCVAIAAGCGDDSEAEPRPLRSPEAAARVKGPKPKIPQGPTANRVIAKDLIEGDGAEIQKGDTVGVHYVAGIYETGEEIESAWVPGTPLGFPYGDGSWSYGWEEGMEGVRVGDRRVLIFPTRPGDVPPGSKMGDTLVYVVDVIEIERPRKKG